MSLRPFKIIYLANANNVYQIEKKKMLTHTKEVAIGLSKESGYLSQGPLIMVMTAKYGKIRQL